MSELSDTEVEQLIESMTRSGAQELDSKQMKRLKTYCRQSDDNIDRVFRQLFHELSRNHSQIRVTSLLIVAHLFQRSHRFRQLIVENLYQMFELCLELDPKLKLPKPKSFAQKLKELTIDLIQKWNNEFGRGYEELRSAVKYLKDNRLVDFTDRVVQNDSQRRRIEEEQQKRRNVLRLKIEKSVKELNEIEVEINSLLTQINSCFDLLMPKMTETMVQNNESDNCLDRIRHLNDFCVEIQVKPFVEVVVNDDTKPIIDNLREFRFELSKILEFKLKRLIHMMSKAYDWCESDLKKAIDLKANIETVGQKFLELKIIGNKDLEQKPNCDRNRDNSSTDDSDDEFEEVPEKEGLELFIPEHRRHEYGLEPLEHMASTSTSSAGISTQLTPELNAIKSEPTLESQCNAVLPSGKLCPRKDQIKCPFHGLIVARDSNGVPLSEEHRKKEEAMKANGPPDWQNPQLLRELKASIGIDLTVHKRSKRKKKYPELEDIRQSTNNSRKRLERKVFKKSVRERVERDLDDIQHKNQTHFGDQWNYSLQR